MNDAPPPNPRAHFEIVRGDNREQPWHARIQSLNGEITWTTETYVEKESAERACGALASMFSPTERATTYNHQHGVDHIEVWLDAEELGARTRLDVQYVDERTPSKTDFYGSAEAATEQGQA